MTIRSIEGGKLTPFNLYSVTNHVINSVNLYPGVSGDDGTWSTSGGFPAGINVTNTTNNVGFNGGGTGSKSFIRFPNTGIPKGVTISSAYMLWEIADQNLATGKIYGNDIDNAVAPTTYEEAGALVTTTAYTDLSGTMTYYTVYQTPDISPIIQEIIDRAGWDSTYAIQFILIPSYSWIGAYYSFYAIDYNFGAKKAILHVDWYYS